MTMEFRWGRGSDLEKIHVQAARDLIAIRELVANSERLHRDLMRRHFGKAADSVHEGHGQLLPYVIY
ncbi:hypothetical protein SD70_29335 [Gordoniibacillus kamchatkensis]|uniref:Uncharacterized protein n=1 Tax=Gordoniibacillus kamchatkensis TaxID=1590651 RepID=A0ABR5AAZ4_9BACL|nr:hypothetical protein SD70_29335 [Paenibacillus sp. VKM B-2647]